MSDAVPLDPMHLLIIGAGPGLGAAVASRSAQQGFRVTLAGRREQVLAALADRLRAGGAPADTFVVDASDPAGYRARLEQFAMHHTRGSSCTTPR